MSNGKASRTRTFFLAALLVPAGGCDSSAALPPVQAPVAASAAPESQPPSARQQTDAARNRVWTLTRDGVFFHDRAALGKTVKLQLPDWQWAGSPYGCMPDLALGPKGEAVITSDVLPTLWKIDPETLAVSVHPLVLDADLDRDVGFSGLTYSSEYGAYFAVSHGQGSLWRIDPLFRRAQKIPLSGTVPKACGLAVRSRSTERKTERLAGLCVYAPQATWSIDLAPDQRSAYLRTASCKVL